MPMNSFASQKEVLFVMYEDIIKTTKFLILRKLLTEPYKTNYSDFIDIGKIDGLSDNDLMRTIFSANDKNILRALSTQSFDFDNTYLDLYLNYDDIIAESKPLAFVNSIHILLQQTFLEKIYIYTPYYDENIYKDIYGIFGTDMIVYVYGELDDVLEQLSKRTRITTYVLNDIMLLEDLIKKGVVAYTNILVSNTGYQYKINEDGIPVLRVENTEALSKQHIFKLAMFAPYDDTN